VQKKTEKPTRGFAQEKGGRGRIRELGKGKTTSIFGKGGREDDLGLI